MLAKANATGFYDGARRRAGDVFEVKDGAKASWFSAVPKDTKPEVKKVEQEKPIAVSELAKKVGAENLKAL